MSDLEQVAQNSQERDRWWLERACEFRVDTVNGQGVSVVREPYSNWAVKTRDRFFYMDSFTKDEGIPGYWSELYSTKFSDRESALAAYLAWKQQQGE